MLIALFLLICTLGGLRDEADVLQGKHFVAFLLRILRTVLIALLVAIILTIYIAYQSKHEDMYFSMRM